MKKILFPIAVAFAIALGAADASAQNRTVGGSANSDRPMPTNSERTRSEDAQMTNGRPMEQIRVNETDSERNRNTPTRDEETPEERRMRKEQKNQAAPVDRSKENSSQSPQ